MALLEVDDIHTFYGNIEALKGISLDVNEGEIVTLIGSNGAGKSTTLRSISGLSPPRTGSIRLAGDPIEHLPPQEIVRLTWFITDKQAYVSRQQEVGAAYREVMGKHFPAMSVVVVSALVEDRAQVEIEATAVLP